MHRKVWRSLNIEKESKLDAYCSQVSDVMILKQILRDKTKREISRNQFTLLKHYGINRHLWRMTSKRFQLLFHLVCPLMWQRKGRKCNSEGKKITFTDARRWQDPRNHPVVWEKGWLLPWFASDRQTREAASREHKRKYNKVQILFAIVL